MISEDKTLELARIATALDGHHRIALGLVLHYAPHYRAQPVRRLMARSETTLSFVDALEAWVAALAVDRAKAT